MRKPALFLGLIITVFLLCPGLALSKISHKERRADKHYEQASYYKAGKLYLKVINKNPSNERAKLKLARTFYRSNGMQEAKMYYSQVIHKRNLVKSIDYLYYAQALLSVGKVRNAKKWANEYLSINPRSIVAQNLVYSLENNNIHTSFSAPDSDSKLKSSITPLQPHSTKGTLLVVAGAERSKSYVITDSQIIEVKNPGKNEEITWLKDLLETNDIQIEQTVDLSPILYAFDEITISEKYTVELDKVVMLMRKYDFIEFELGAHTDAFGSDVYNKHLSTKRANTVLDYLLDKKIESKRLLVVVYGESSLVNKCKDKQPCAKQQHRLKRRTEFRLIYMDENQVVSNY